MRLYILSTNLQKIPLNSHSHSLSSLSLLLRLRSSIDYAFCVCLSLSRLEHKYGNENDDAFKITHKKIYTIYIFRNKKNHTSSSLCSIALSPLSLKKTFHPDQTYLIDLGNFPLSVSNLENRYLF